VTGSFVNTSFPPRRIDLADGRVLAPGERADDVEPGSDHNRALEEEGALTRVHEPTADEKPKGGKS